MAEKIVSLDPDRAEKAAELLRENPVFREHLSEASIEALAESLADAGTVTIDEETGEILDDMGRSTGRTLEDLTDDYVPEIYIKGTNQQLSFDVGGGQHRKVIGSTLAVKGMNKLPMVGQVPRLGRIKMVIEVEVQDVAFKTVRHPQTGKVLGAERFHTATVESAKRVED